MPPPIRCFTCGAAVGHLWDRYWTLMRTEHTSREACDALGIPVQNYCCRGVMLTFVPPNGLEVPSAPPDDSKFSFKSAELSEPQRPEEEQASGETCQQDSHDHEAASASSKTVARMLCK